MRWYLYFIVALVLTTVSSCDSGSETQNPEEEGATEVSQQADTSDTVLATIDGKKVYASELESLLINLFGEYRAGQMDKESRKRALESLIASRVLAQEAEKHLSVDELREIENTLKRDRENRLINAYMRSKLEPGTLSQQEVKEYYDNNLDKFGQSTIRQYTLVTTKQPLAEEARERYMRLVNEQKNKGDISGLHTTLKQNGFDVQMQSAELDKKLVDKKLFDFITNQPLNQVSNMIFVGNRPFVVQVSAEKQIKARPLERVEETIKKTLALKKLKQAIKKESERVLGQTEVIYSE